MTSFSRTRQFAILTFCVGVVYLLVDVTKLEVAVAKLQKATLLQTNFLSSANTQDYSQTIIRGGYQIYQNAIRPNKRFFGNESVTYSTHSDPTFLANLIPLAERWQGPISVAIYAPGTDYDMTLEAIAHLRTCFQRSQLVQDFVTFHLFSEIKYASKAALPKLPIPYCDREMPSIEGRETFRKANNLTYPINVARNTARQAANTHYVLPSDIELYPNPGLIRGFLKMVTSSKEEAINQSRHPKAYVVSIFEIEEGHMLPQNKSQLLEMMDDKVVIPFHARYCPECHRIPGAEKWIQDPGEEDQSHITTTAKRIGKYKSWEPIFIGSQSDPLYDERLSWEGRSDKMTHAFQMCLMDYDFLVLDNAFLVHKPGIKTKKNNPTKPDQRLVNIQNKLIKNTIIPEIIKNTGRKKECEKGK